VHSELQQVVNHREDQDLLLIQVVVGSHLVKGHLDALHLENLRATDLVRVLDRRLAEFLVHDSSVYGFLDGCFFRRRLQVAVALVGVLVAV
jgi:hypothetical protein